MDMLESHISPFHPALVELVKQCLHNAPEDRPSTEEVQAVLQGLRTKTSRSSSSNMPYRHRNHKYR